VQVDSAGKYEFIAQATTTNGTVLRTESHVVDSLYPNSYDLLFEQESYIIKIMNRSPIPSEIYIHPGDRVTWRNEGPYVNSIYSYENGEMSDYMGYMFSGETITKIYDNNGIYDYYIPFGGYTNRSGRIVVSQNIESQ
jgi:plastocyanin